MSAADLDRFLDVHPASILIELEETNGSTPRAAGTFMLVAKDAIWDTIGGGQFEYIAIDHARAMLAGRETRTRLDIPLGPDIGQCCGGRTLLHFARIDATLRNDLRGRLHAMERQRPHVAIFGGGHVGKALAQALSLLPLAVSVIETRIAELNGLPDGVEAWLLAMPEAAIAGLPSGSAVIIVTHDHALDFLIAREALSRTDLAYTGMIGSATKRATFSHWLLREGGGPDWLERLTLPIGGGGVKDKRPEVIAAMTVAEVLTALARCETTIEASRA